MRLTQGLRPDLQTAIGAVLDRRLSRTSAAPVCVAFSGGGDSLALLIAADAWARSVGRDLLVLHVDHGLQADAADWARRCADVARRLDRRFVRRAWCGPKPPRGLPAAARAARHRLIAEAARTAGARVVLMGHTADDLAEAAAMRAAGSSTPDPKVWAPSPVWPAGRDVFLLRPLLGLRRGELREALVEGGWSWIEDPANADLAYARSRARRQRPVPPADAAPRPDPSGLAHQTREPWPGVLSLPRAALRRHPAADVFVGVAALCAGGGSRPPAPAARRRLAEALSGEGPVAATLAGARVAADAERVLFFREAGEAARGGLASRPLAPGVTEVWDGRFEIEAQAPGLCVRRLAGVARRLPPAARTALQEVPQAARGALPVWAKAADPLAVSVDPALARATSLVLPRLQAACGLIDREPVAARTA